MIDRGLALVYLGFIAIAVVILVFGVAEVTR